MTLTNIFEQNTAGGLLSATAQKSTNGKGESADGDLFASTFFGALLNIKIDENVINSNQKNAQKHEEGVTDSDNLLLMSGSSILRFQGNQFSDVGGAKQGNNHLGTIASGINNGFGATFHQIEGNSNTEKNNIIQTVKGENFIFEPNISDSNEKKSIITISKVDNEIVVSDKSEIKTENVKTENSKSENVKSVQGESHLIALGKEITSSVKLSNVQETDGKPIVTAKKLITNETNKETQANNPSATLNFSKEVHSAINTSSIKAVDTEIQHKPIVTQEFSTATKSEVAVLQSQNYAVKSVNINTNEQLLPANREIKNVYNVEAKPLNNSLKTIDINTNEPLLQAKREIKIVSNVEAKPLNNSLKTIDINTNEPLLQTNREIKNVSNVDAKPLKNTLKTLDINTNEPLLQTNREIKNVSNVDAKPLNNSLKTTNINTNEQLLPANREIKNVYNVEAKPKEEIISNDKVSRINLNKSDAQNIIQPLVIQKNINESDIIPSKVQTNIEIQKPNNEEEHNIKQLINSLNTKQSAKDQNNTEQTVNLKQQAQPIDEKTIENANNKQMNNIFTKSANIIQQGTQENNDEQSFSQSKNNNKSFSEVINNVPNNQDNIQQNRISAEKTIVYKTYERVSLDEMPKLISRITQTTAESTTSYTRFNLSPKSLGTVFVELTMIDNTVSAKLTSSNPETVKLLEGSIAKLTEMLKGQGLTTENLQIRFQNDNTGNNKFSETLKDERGYEDSPERKSSDTREEKRRKWYGASSAAEINEKQNSFALSGSIIEKYI